MPGYALLDENDGSGLLPWSWATERLTAAHNYWIATTRPGGRPHAMAVWGVWLDDRFYFSTGRESRKARNLSVDPRCVVCTERADEAVVVEGLASEVRDSAVLRRVVEVYNAKYQWDMEPTQEAFYEVRPEVAFAFIEHAADFPGSATRWTFDAE
jgi:nitroimidazol reductase NimA-like FMN-containing flavoprotein (pyridoxamine 5'-phosphate oxidase superfamily)